MSIKKSIRILLILSSILPVLLLSVLVVVLLSNHLVLENTQNLKKVAEANINGLSAIIATKQTQTSTIAYEQEIIDYIKQSNKSNELTSTLVNDYLEKQQLSCKDFLLIRLYNINNKMIACSNPIFLESFGKQNSSHYDIQPNKSPVLTTSDIQFFNTSSQTKPAFNISLPILDPNTNQPLGYIVSTIDSECLYTFLSNIQIEKTGYGILLAEDSTIIFHRDSNLIGEKINLEKLSKIVTAKDREENISYSGAVKYHWKDQNVYGYCLLPNLNWVLFVQQDISEIGSVVNIMIPLLSITFIVIIIIVFVLGNHFSKKYSTPIIALRDAMRTASDGNLTVQSNIKSNNELGELSKNFNKMLHIIKTNYEDLESMHEELLSNEEQLRSNYDHIEYLAYHDTLTNLPNKLAFLDYVNAVLSSSLQDITLHAVYFVDLDNFKTVNDTLGHEYGDALLVKTAQILTSIIGANGMLARAGGDEFLLFKENITSRKSAVDFASQIIDYFKNPLDLEGKVVYVSMSIGIAIYPENGLASNILIKNSDIAMYKSKDTGKNKFTLFNSNMEEELHRNTLIIETLRSAIENQEIYILYQPLFELSSNNIIGFEALMRIKSKRLGFLSPIEFIPIAEESGLINELSSWLIAEACRFNKQLIDLGATPRPVSVNISSIQLNRPGFVTLLSEILRDTQLPPEYLELEITESTLVASIMDAAKLLSNLQSLGVRVSLDDFGTGYSALNYLTKLPINTLKIDKSFIDNICYDTKDSSIAQAIIQLAHSLDIRVVAEGVEHEEQLKLLKKQRCDIIQGYIYSAPLHPNALLELIREDDLISQCSLF